jgi:glucokinase
MESILSLDIGGTKIAAALMTPEGATLASCRGPSLAREGPERVIARLLDLARRVIREGEAEVRSVGISCGGPLDPVTGIVLSPPNLPGWDRTPLRRIVAEGLEIDPASVHVENDANACALAELHFGAARGRLHAIYLTMSTGIGGGLILDGRLYRGATFNAGEVGHQVVLADGPPCGCGRRGCLEAVASGSGIAARLRARFDTLSPRLKQSAGSADRITAEHLFDAVRSGDRCAVEFFDETMTLLARGIANLVFILNPQIVILGTLARHAGDLMLVPLRQQVGRLCWPVLAQSLEIVSSPLGARLEELSGLAVALEAERPPGRTG